MNKCRIENGFALCDSPSGHHCDFATWSKRAVITGGTCLTESGGVCGCVDAVIAATGKIAFSLPDHVREILNQIVGLNLANGWDLEENARRIMCETLRQWRDRQGWSAGWEERKP